MNINDILSNNNQEHLHRNQGMLWVLIFCLIEVLKEKQLLFPDEIRDRFERRVRELEKDEKQIDNLFKFIFLEDEVYKQEKDEIFEELCKKAKIQIEVEDNEVKSFFAPKFEKLEKDYIEAKKSISEVEHEENLKINLLNKLDEEYKKEKERLETFEKKSGNGVVEYLKDEKKPNYKEVQSGLYDTVSKTWIIPPKVEKQ